MTNTIGVLLFILATVEALVSAYLFIGYALMVCLSPESESVAGKTYWDCWLDFHRMIWEAFGI